MSRFEKAYENSGRISYDVVYRDNKPDTEKKISFRPLTGSIVARQTSLLFMFNEPRFIWLFAKIITTGDIPSAIIKDILQEQMEYVCVED